MSEDLAKQLASYKAQLQQVEAALSGNADNEDLLKLKKDLQVRGWERPVAIRWFFTFPRCPCGNRNVGR